MSRIALSSWWAVVLVACCCSCDSDQQTVTQLPSTSAGGGVKEYKVVTTCGMLTDLVRQVAGIRGDVVGLMNERVDPHLYKPTRDDINTLMSADIVFYVGLNLEGRMTDTFVKVGRAGIPVHAVAEGIDESYLREPEEFAGHYDPHVWMDIKAWSQCLEYVVTVLSEHDPDDAEFYRMNADQYLAYLNRLDQYAQQSISSIPEQQRILVTAHDAFGYFGRAYGIEVRALQGITTESEASVEDVNRLVDLIVSRKIPAIFVESSVNAEGIRAIVEGAASRGVTVSIGGELFSDAMGAPGTYRGTYVGMIDHNVTTITRALGGDAPEAGVRGLLLPPEEESPAETRSEPQNEPENKSETEPVSPQ